MKTLFIISIVFFYISFGTALIIKNKNKSKSEFFGSEFFGSDSYFLKGWSTIFCYIVPVINLCYLFDISWYWLAIINFLMCLIVPYPIAIIYCFIFGIKTRPQHSYETGEFGRHHMYETDEVLTLAIALLLFIIALIL